MGCLPSRSTTVSPVESSGQNSYNPRRTTTKTATTTTTTTTTTRKPIRNGYTSNQKLANGHTGPLSNSTGNNINNKNSSSNRGANNISNSSNHNNNNNNNNRLVRNNNNSASDNNSMNSGEDDIMSILMNDQQDQGNNKDPSSSSHNNDQPSTRRRATDNNNNNIKNNSLDDSPEDDGRASPGHRSMESADQEDDLRGRAAADGDANGMDNTGLVSSGGRQKSTDENSFDEDLNVELLGQYIQVDFEISQLEDKDALRIYHEKIEQLEQLERELDMISSEAEEVAARSESSHLAQMDRFGGGQSPMMMMNDPKGDGEENNSMLSGATGSMSAKSSFRRNNNQQQQQQHQQQQQQQHRNGQLLANNNNNNSNRHSLRKNGDDQVSQSNRNLSSSYSTVEEVFNRKIILEKERDRLKKEVEMVIVECDKLQQKYKKRDEILDKLFDGGTGNGLENHLEQQLNWLMEQKHYVDQVFYAWKRAETLTSQTCEQFASALELLKRLPKVQDPTQRAELAHSISQLLVKSRQDMEQAQRYNPNVDAPFFTDTETDRFDKIIDTISTQPSISQSEYSQIATVIQFAYKRAVSIRLWLEQILQITIARDSFELAEEYKWIAIQLRKERITLIKSKLQEAPYRSLVQSVQEQVKKQQQQEHLMVTNNEGNTNNNNNNNNNEVNRDSGIESDDIDIEEEIYRLLEMNKSRLEASMGGVGGYNNNNDNYQLKTSNIQGNHNGNNKSSSDQNRDEMMRERIQRRVRGDHQLDSNRAPMPLALPSVDNETSNNQRQQQQHRQLLNGSITTTNTTTNNSNTSQLISAPGSATLSKLKVELDEAARQDLLKQVDQIHVKHRSNMERLRGNNKAKASDFIMNRMQQARNNQQQMDGKT